MTWSLPNVTSLLPYLLVPLLYTGPLYVHSIESALPLQRRWSFQEDMLSIFTTLQGLRNYIIVRTVVLPLSPRI